MSRSSLSGCAGYTRSAQHRPDTGDPSPEDHACRRTHQVKLCAQCQTSRLSRRPSTVGFGRDSSPASYESERRSVSIGAAVLALIGVVVGVVGTLGVELVRAHREGKAAKHAREEAKEDERARFQRETILALQEAMVEAEKSNLWVVALTGDQRVDARREGDRLLDRVEILMVRVTDEEARRLVDEWRRLLLDLIWSKVLDQPAIATAIYGTGEALRGANVRLGMLLREVL
jgi:hypothetical protein